MNRPLPNLEGLPYELIFDILLKSNDLNTIASYCQTNKWASAVCEDENFWKSMYYQNYGRSVLLLKGESWKGRFRDRMGKKVQISPIAAWGDNYGVIDNLGNFYHTLSLDDIYARPKWDQIGKSNTDIIREEGDLLKPIKIPFEQKIISFSTSPSTTAVITDQGLVYLWGINSHKKLDYQRKLIKFPVKAVKVSTNMYRMGHGYLPIIAVGIIGEDNYVYIWYGGESPSVQPIPIKAVDLYIGFDRLALVDLEGKLYLWGMFQDVVDNRGIPFFNSKYIKTPTLFPFSVPIKQIIIVPYHWEGPSIFRRGESSRIRIPTQQIHRMLFLSYDGIPYLLDGTPLLKDNVFGFTRTKDYMRSMYPKLTPKPYLPDDGSPIKSISVSSGIIAMIGENGKLYIFRSKTKETHARSIKKLLQGKKGLPRNEMMGKRIFYRAGSDLQDDTIKPIEVDIGSDLRDDTKKSFGFLNIGSPVRYVSVGNYFVVAVTDDGVVNIWEN